MATRSSGAASINLGLLAASIVLGFLLTVQFRSAAVRMPAREQSRLVSADTIRLLEEEQRQLKERITALRADISALQHQSPTETYLSNRLVVDLDYQRLVAGLVPVRGPAVVVTLDDSSRNVPAGEDANNYLIHDYELRDVVSLLWLAGAEAVAINGERLVSLSSIYCVGSTVLVNDTRLSPPYEIVAIGNTSALAETLDNPRHLTKLRARTKTYGVQFKVSQYKDVTIPAYSGNLTIRYARPTTVPTEREQQRKQEM